MRASARVAPPPKKEAPRKSRSRASRGTTNFINSNADVNTTATLQVQWLAARYGLLGAHAALIASLAFGGAHAG